MRPPTLAMPMGWAEWAKASSFWPCRASRSEMPMLALSPVPAILGASFEDAFCACFKWGVFTEQGCAAQETASKC
jgi:hypothetical protein